MAKTLRKDTRHTIAKTWPRFVSIACLMVLAVFALVGLKVTGPNMRDTAASFFDQSQLTDVTVISTWGLDDTDQSLFDSVSDIRDVEYGYAVDTLIAGTDTSVRVFSLPERISLPEVTSGSLPVSTDEIALDFRLEGTYEIGDTIVLDEPNADEAEDESETEDEDPSEMLTHNTFRVVGFVKSAEFIDREQFGQTMIGTGQLNYFAFVTADAFDSDVYMSARLLFEDTEGAEPYDSAYLALLDQHKATLEDLLVPQAQARLAVIVSDAQAEIDDGRTENCRRPGAVGRRARGT